MFFQDRTDAGKKLAQKLGSLGRDFSGWCVVGIARGGIIIAQEVAQALGLPFSAIYQDDLHHDGELLVATAFDAGCAFTLLHAPQTYRFIPDLRQMQVEDLEDLEELADKLASRQTPWQLRRILATAPRVLLCDDGIVSGRSLLTATLVLKHLGVSEVLSAVPVTHATFTRESIGSELIGWRSSYADQPQPTGMYYFNFADTSDDEVTAALVSAVTVP